MTKSTKITEAKRRSAEAALDLRAALSRAIRGLRAGLAQLLLFSVTLNVLALATPLYLFQISDRVLTSRSKDTLVMLTMIVVLALVAYAMLDTLRRRMMLRMAMRLETDLAAPVLASATQSATTGSPQDLQIVNDLAQLRSFLTSATLTTMLDAPLTPLFFVAVFCVHPDLGWIIAVAAALTLLLALWNQRATRVDFAEAGFAGGRAAGYLDAIGRTAPAIGAMGMSPETIRLWGNETAIGLARLVRAQDKNNIISGISKFLRMLVQVGILGWGAHLALSGELTGGMIIAASMISGRALAPLEGAIDGWRSFVLAQSAYGRIVRLLTTSPLNVARLRQPSPEGWIELSRVLYAPPPTKRVLLNGVSFVLQPGESLAVLGNSGAGKTTLAKMLIGAIQPTAGEVRISGVELRHWDPAQFGEAIGYLPQETQLFPASVKANISRLRSDALDKDIVAAAKFAGVHEMITRLPQGYETILGPDGAPLSGGQRQRLGLARAFYGNPVFVVLDEPNANLDGVGEEALAQTLEKARVAGVTVITITQRHTLLRQVDKVLAMDEGRAVAFGARDETLTKLFGADKARALLQNAPARGPHTGTGKSDVKPTP